MCALLRCQSQNTAVLHRANTGLLFIYLFILLFVVAVVCVYVCVCFHDFILLPGACRSNG